MALSAGLIIPLSQPNLSWSSEKLIWENYLIKVVYLGNENVSDNPVSSNDIIVDQRPNIFRVLEVKELLEDDTFRVDVSCVNKPKTIQNSLLTGTQRGLICTPNELGFINPYWDGTVVELTPFRMAMEYNFKHNQTLKEKTENAGSTTEPIELPFIPEKFIQLSDTPGVYGIGGQFVRLTEEGTALEFVDPPSSGGIITTYLITINSNSYGTVIPNGVFEVPAGANLDVLINPFPGYEINEIIKDGESITPKQRIVFEEITEEHSLNISFSTPGLEEPIGGGISDIKFPVLDLSSLNHINRKIAIGYEHILVLGSDNKIYCQGKNNAGQFGNNTTISYTENWYKYDPPAVFDKVYSEYRTSAAIDNLGYLWVWGENWFNKIGSYDDIVMTPIKVSEELVFKQFSIGGTLCLGLTQDGYIYACGELGIDVGNFTEFTRIGNPDKTYTYVSAGAYNAAVIDDEGKIFTFGEDRGYEGIFGRGISAGRPDSFGFYQVDTVHKYDKVVCRVLTSFMYDRYIKEGSGWEENNFFGIDIYRKLHTLGTQFGDHILASDKTFSNNICSMSNGYDYSLLFIEESGEVYNWYSDLNSIEYLMEGGKGIYCEAGDMSLFVTDKGDIFIRGGGSFHNIVPSSNTGAFQKVK